VVECFARIPAEWGLDLATRGRLAGAVLERKRALLACMIDV
jgi:hypothetical protein